MILWLSLWKHRVGAEVKTLSATSGSPFGAAVMTKFGLARHGTVRIDYSLKTLKGEDTSRASMDRFNMMFIAVVLNEEQRSSYFAQFENEGEQVAMSSGDANKYCNDPALARVQMFGTGTYSHTLSGMDARAEQTSVVVLQCKQGLGVQGPRITADLTVTMTNIRPDGGTDHLGVEDIMVIRTIEGELIMYWLMLGGLIAQIYYNREHNRHLQYMFLTVLSWTIITTFVRHGRWSYMNNHGQKNIHLEYANNMFVMIEEVITLTCVLLMVLGWSTVHFRLTQIQIRVSAGALGLFLVMGLGSSSCLEDTSTACESLFLVTYIIRALLMLGIIICLNFTITQLRAMLAHTQWDPSSAYCYARTKQFQTFRVGFVLYLLLPTAILLVQDILYTWEQDWLGTALPDILQVLMYLLVGSTFAPLKDHFINRAFR